MPNSPPEKAPYPAWTRAEAALFLLGIPFGIVAVSFILIFFFLLPIWLPD